MLARYRASLPRSGAGRSHHRHHGRRVVAGQRLLQTASDIFLGWTGDLVDYGRLCGWVLARAHARSGDAAAIGGYLGTGDRFDAAVADFAGADHAAFARAGEGLTAPGAGRSAATDQRKGAEG